MMPSWYPRARRSDPETSIAAARSIAPTIAASQAEVLVLFREFGPMTDEEARQSYGEGGRQSESGLRSRRAELVRMGLLEDSGRRWPGRTGRQMIVWAVTPTKEVR
jgi:hypothetical protein